MADARDPDPFRTLLSLQFPEYGSLSFGKILIDDKPIGIALNPGGRYFVDHPLTSSPEEITQGSVVRAVRYEGAVLTDLETAMRKYNLDGDSCRISDIAFVAILDGVFNQLARNHPVEHRRLFGKDRLVIGDVGCGSMPYGAMMAHYFLRHGKNVRIVGIDPDVAEEYLKFHERDAKENISGLEVDFVHIPSCLDESPRYLEEAGVRNFDLLTMFNPSGTSFIDIGDLPESFRESALLLAALDDYYGFYSYVKRSLGAQRDDVVRNFAENGYMVLMENVNGHAVEMSEYGYKYNPILVAQRIPVLLDIQ